MSDFRESKNGLNSSIFYLHSSESKGRGIYSNCSIKAGSIILQEEAYCSVIDKSWITSTCTYCGFMINSSIYGHTPDDDIRYCSIECMKSDLKIYDIEKNVLKSFAKLNIESNDSIRLIIRIACLKAICDSFDDITESSDNNTIFPLEGKKNRFQHIMRLEAVSSQTSFEDKTTISCIAELLTEALNENNLDLTSEGFIFKKIVTITIIN
jgi:hypothetical protein